MQIRYIAAAAAGAIVLTLAGAASATVTELQYAAPGATQQIYINGFEPGSNVVDPGLGATFALTLSSITNGGYSWNFSYELANISTEQ